MLGLGGLTLLDSPQKHSTVRTSQHSTGMPAFTHALRWMSVTQSNALSFHTQASAHATRLTHLAHSTCALGYMCRMSELLTMKLLCSHHSMAHFVISVAAVNAKLLLMMVLYSLQRSSISGSK